MVGILLDKELSQITSVRWIYDDSTAESEAWYAEIEEFIKMAKNMRRYFYYGRF